MVLVSITVSTIVLVEDWRHVHRRSAGSLLEATLIGTPFGLLLTRVDGSIVKMSLGHIHARLSGRAGNGVLLASRCAELQLRGLH